MSQLNGFLIIDKKPDISSAKAVAMIKKYVRPSKIGHAGTLDPFATGVLPIAIGEATKAISFLVDAKKEYEFTVKFGASTDTDDLTGKVIAETDVIPNSLQIAGVTHEFTGEISQIPPIYSAIKVDGRRAYDMARKGEIPTLQTRKIVVYKISFEMIGDIAKFFVTCSKGTYIRSLARDIAIRLGSLGYVTSLRRTKVGRFDIADALNIDDLSDSNISEKLLPIEGVLDGIPALEVDEQGAYKVKCGQKLPISIPFDQVAIIFRKKLIAIGKSDGESIKSVRGFNH